MTTKELIREYNDSVEPITTEDIKYIRSLNTACIDFYIRDGIVHSDIRGIERVQGYRGHSENIYGYVPCKVEFDIYKGSNNKLNLEYAQIPKTCCAHLDYMQSYRGTIEDLSAVAYFMRAGDILTIQWQFSDGNGYVSSSKCTTEPDNETGYRSAVNADIFMSRCYLVIERGKRKFRFLLQDSVCPMNSASMIRFW